MPVVGLADITAVATRSLVLDAVRCALVAHAEGATVLPPPAHLDFPAGDCHVKTGYVKGMPHFAVKVATGFPGRGLPANDGLLLVIDASTGRPVAALADEGWLTAWRTAAAGALVTHALTPAGVTQVGVLGTGPQARLQVEWLRELRPVTQVVVWGRRPAAAAEVCADLRAAGVAAEPGAAERAASQPCVIAATPATAPLAPASRFALAKHITAIGTDMPGKNELPPELFAQATLIATDDHDQCLDHGDFGNAVRAGEVAADADVPVGTVLGCTPRKRLGRDVLSIADLTGIGAADAAVASAVTTALWAA
ncbi:ornithine cyclodeaminase [Actinophytocola xanthii]|uniref:Ornithine cyclodeaminase n=1 Tax=Actinophytocola xanthii TaxID=1912961 RepID=A0A1Q8CAD6_9PSEU|nr:ornithine cyclodeaminase [Actinophytocola xanthii]